MGSRDTLIVNGYKACQDVFVDNINGRISADRPDFKSFNVQLPENEQEFGMASFTDNWRIKKKIVTKAFKIITTKQTIHDLIRRKASDLVHTLGNQQASTDPCASIKNSITNILLPLVFGNEVEFTEDPVFTEIHLLLENFNKYQKADGYLGDLFPWVSYIYPDNGFKEYIKQERRVSELCRAQYDQHRSLFEAEKIKDMIDALIFTSKHIREQRLDNKDNEDIKDTEVRSIVGAGLETSITIIQ